MLKETIKLIKDLKRRGVSGPMTFRKVFPQENEYLVQENCQSRNTGITSTRSSEVSTVYNKLIIYTYYVMSLPQEPIIL